MRATRAALKTETVTTSEEISAARPRPARAAANPITAPTMVPTTTIGTGAKEADKRIMQYLKARGRVFKQGTMVHSYPHCYRTDVPLLYRALKTW